MGRRPPGCVRISRALWLGFALSKVYSCNVNKRNRPGKFSRRTLLKGVAGLSAVAALPGCKTITSAGAGIAVARKPDAIRKENLKPGSQSWMLQKTGIDPATKYRCPWI